MGMWTALSLVDVESIGAGGGSLGWVDARGMLRVGPRSAGAVPGPACYGRGGTDATVTDALVVLGYIDPGPVPRRRHGARRRRRAATPAPRLGAPLGLDAGGDGVGHPRDRPGRDGQGGAVAAWPRSASTRATHAMLELRRVRLAVHRRHRRGHRRPRGCSCPSWPRCSRRSARPPPTCAASGSAPCWRPCPVDTGAGRRS